MEACEKEISQHQLEEKQWRGFTTELPPPDQSRPKSCGELMGGQVILDLPTPPNTNMISSCALYTHEILIYNTLIGTQQDSLAHLTNRVALHSSSLALTLTFAHLTQVQRVKQSSVGDCYPPGFC